MDPILATGQFFQSLSRETLILTPNQRLGLFLQHTYDQHQANTRTSWPSLNTKPIEQWLTELFSSYRVQENSQLLLLNTAQETQVWQKIIEEQPPSSYYFSPDVIEAMIDAWNIVNEWLIPLDDPQFYYKEDSQHFKAAALAFKQYCLEHHYLSPSELPNFIENHIACLLNLLPTEIVLLGFDTLPLAYKQLLNALKKHNIQIRFHDFNVNNVTHARYEFETEDDEIKAMATWALEQANLGYQYIGCVIPNLLSIRKKVARIFEDTFHPQQLFLPYTQDVVFSLSGGEALAQQPLIKTLLIILKCCHSTIEFDALSYLLKTPFLEQGISEQSQRMLLEVKLREELYLLCHFEEIIEIINKEKTPVFHSILKKISIFTKQYRLKKMSIAQWLSHIQQLMQQIGWPGERSLSSTEFQQLKQFTALCHELIASEPFSLDYQFDDFRYLLSSMAEKKLYQPKTRWPKVQVLGILEAAGQSFDSLWVMGLTDKTWPTASAPNPFIPLQLQKSSNVPRSHAENEFAFAKAMTQRWQHSAKYLIVSSFKTQDDEHYTPSHLIQAIPAQPCSLLSPIPFIKAQLFGIEDKCLPLSTPAFSVSSNLIKKYAECPFQAFAEFRLKARALASPNFLTSNRIRGTILHEILFKIWRTWPSSEELSLAWQDNAAHTIKALIKESLLPYYKANSLSNQLDFFQLECERYTQLILNWLEVELKRDTFKIANLEQKVEYHYKNIHFKLRVDRIDQINDQDLLLIDYKTGDISPTAWFDNKFLEPQLPLYALSIPNIQGIYIATISPKQQAFSGVATEAVQVKNIKISGKAQEKMQEFLADKLDAPQKIQLNKLNEADFDKIKAGWQIKIHSIIDKFIAGDYPVQPAEAKHCQYCQKEILCRINSQSVKPQTHASDSQGN